MVNTRNQTSFIIHLIHIQRNIKSSKPLFSCSDYNCNEWFIKQCPFVKDYHNDPKFLDRQVLANSADTGQAGAV